MGGNFIHSVTRRELVLNWLSRHVSCSQEMFWTRNTLIVASSLQRSSMGISVKNWHAESHYTYLITTGSIVYGWNHFWFRYICYFRRQAFLFCWRVANAADNLSNPLMDIETSRQLRAAEDYQGQHPELCTKGRCLVLSYLLHLRVCMHNA